MPFGFWFPLVILPPPESGIVISKLEGQSSSTETRTPTIGKEVLPSSLRLRVRVHPEEGNDRDMMVNTSNYPIPADVTAAARLMRQWRPPLGT